MTMMIQIKGIKSNVLLLQQKLLVQKKIKNHLFLKALSKAGHSSSVL